MSTVTRHLSAALLLLATSVTSLPAVAEPTPQDLTIQTVQYRYGPRPFYGRRFYGGPYRRRFYGYGPRFYGPRYHPHGYYRYRHGYRY